MFEDSRSAAQPAVWPVGALCRAIADALEARFNPVSVQGEISGFSRAASGHCYFSLKDSAGQLRCAMFRRAAGALDFSPREGELVQVRGRLGVYEPRGDLQLIVESMNQAGQGALYEQFLKLKAKLEGEGLFDAARKRALPAMPRGIGVVTSLGAAALHDVVTALQRRVPHIEVLVVPALVQGPLAPRALIQALSNLYQLTQEGRGLEADLSPNSEGQRGTESPVIDVILLVRGGGSIDDLWAFNDEQLARVIALSPVPVVCGVGHETDFSIADFVADLRAPTPTAAAELVAQPREVGGRALAVLARHMNDAVERRVDQHHQRLDQSANRLGRPSAWLARQELRVASLAQRLPSAAQHAVRQQQSDLRTLGPQLGAALQRGLKGHVDRLNQAGVRLGLLDPSLVLQRGYAWLRTPDGVTLSSVAQVAPGQAVQAVLADGEVDLVVTSST